MRSVGLHSGHEYFVDGGQALAEFWKERERDVKSLFHKNSRTAGARSIESEIY